MDYRYIGKDAPVSDAAAKAAGSLPYAGDLQLPRMLQMQLILSPVAHGEVCAIDVSQALALEGVAAVLYYDNTSQVPYSRSKVRTWDQSDAQETLFTRHVRFVGDRIAAVVAETPALAARAASLVKLDIRPLPPVLTPQQALEQNLCLHEQNSIIRLPPIGCGDYDSAPGTEFVHHTRSQRLTHMAMEPHCAVADYDPVRGRMTVWTATQSIFGVRSAIASILDLPMSRVRVIKAPMGGSFGGKQEMILEPLAACAALHTGRPVKLQLSRREVILATIVKHPLDAAVRAKFSPAGDLEALDCRLLMDAGAYQTNTPVYTAGILQKLGRVYRIPNLRGSAACVCTNTPVSGSYRGWGAPEAALILENMMNAAARHFGLDPVALRLRNALRPGEKSPLGGCSLGDLRLREALELGAQRFGWQERRRRSAGQQGRYRRGIGMAAGTHTCGFYPGKADWGTVSLQMEEDGSVSVNCSLHDHGCGSVAAFQRIVAEVLSLSPELVSVPEGDTAYNPLDNGCYASRTIYVLGGALERAARKLRDRLTDCAARMLDCPPESICLLDGMLYCAQQPDRRCSYGQAACFAAETLCCPLYITHHDTPDTNPAPAAVHFAEVEVDTYTGLCRVVDYLAVHDIGRALNPALCRGQIGSALQQGLGMVFCEQVVIDPVTGDVRNPVLARYPVARASELPEIDVLFLEHGDEKGPFGAKSLGEVSYVPVVPALLAAVNDALDTDLSQLPLTPERILAALAEKEG